MLCISNSFQRKVRDSSFSLEGNVRTDLPLLDYCDCPEYLLHNAHVHRGYRVDYSLKKCLKSMFTMHNGLLILIKIAYLIRNLQYLDSYPHYFNLDRYDTLTFRRCSGISNICRPCICYTHSIYEKSNSKC